MVMRAPPPPQILIETAQKQQALGEVQARHQEILRLEENIGVRDLVGLGIG